MIRVTAIFDIGKTNKKFFLFDENLQEVYRDYTRFDEIQDEDGFPCDDVKSISTWMLESFRRISENSQFEITKINFSGYGASFVHLDKDGEPIAPLYNYLKPYPDEILRSFYQKYGDELKLATETASPPLKMLNSGLQLYWLKYARPELFAKIRWSIHMPQYLSYVFTGMPISDYTSVGCHTMLWDYEKGDYHRWVYAEKIDRILPPLVETNSYQEQKIGDRVVKIGVGIHDSSAALIPYKKQSEDPFLLMSTGTWSICLNPFNEDALTVDQLKRDCLNFLGTEGKTVRASRLFLGNEYKIWSRRLSEYFNQPYDKHSSIIPDQDILIKLADYPAKMFKWESIEYVGENVEETDLNRFKNYEEAYHKLLKELTDLQVEAVLLAEGNSQVKTLFIDGGFADNELFIYFLTQKLNRFKISVTKKPLGSAIGAAMVVADSERMVEKMID